MNDNEFEILATQILDIVRGHPKTEVIGLLECVKLIIFTSERE